MKAVIFASADIYDYSFCKKYTDEADVIISCDGGARHCYALGIIPDYILGDFDSADPKILDYYRQKGVFEKKFPKKKDETDMELAFNCAFGLGASEITILGGIGSRLDHTLGNVHLLERALLKGVKATLINEKNKAELIDGHITVKGEKGDIVSLIPFKGDVKGVTLKGMEYPLLDAYIPYDSTIGISNIMLADEADISFKEGLLLVIRAKD
ncbi:MAG: thiamine diphosphokinase [Lachnospiraceae bacterium]|nr:thiamine diphosphokinase [Lachnospiraceae bacterium]